MPDLSQQIEVDGFSILPGVFTAGECGAIIAELEAALVAHAVNDGSIRSGQDRVYASRNLLAVWPQAAELARKPALRSAVRRLLGPACGLVRGLYFDKPPGRSWSLPWHKDLTVAVRDNRLASEHFSKPTHKAGVPHAEAPETLLANMLTARIHLDEVTDENGPLRVIRGSHLSGKRTAVGAATVERTASILVSAGDVLLMRPLVEHCSGNSQEGTVRHRRIVHLEFAAHAGLPDGFAWHDFLPLGDSHVR